MKRICLSFLALACGGTEPLTPTDPIDASVSVDSAPVPEKPSFVVTEPIDGQLFADPRVEVRGTAMHLDTVDVAGVAVPIVDGAFTHVLSLEEGERVIVVSAAELEERIEVRVDLSPPRLEVVSPPRGAFLRRQNGNTIRVEGRVSDAVSAIDLVRINGIEVPVSDERFFLDLPAEHGLNLIDAIAFDEAGHSADVLQGAIWGDYAPWEELLPDAISLGLRADVFEVFEAQLEQGLATGLSTAAIAQQNPELTIDSIAFSAIDVELVPQNGFLDVSIVISDLAIDFTLDTVIIGIPIITPGTMTADSVDVTTEIHVSVVDGQVESHTEGSTAAITSFGITAQNIGPVITNLIAGYLEPQLETGFVQAIDAQDLSAIFDLSQFLPDTFGAEITSAQIEPSGMTMVADAALLLPQDPRTPLGPGVLIDGGSVPGSIPTTHQIRTSLSNDLVNGALFHSWRSGTFTASIAGDVVPGEFALDAGTFALFFGDQLFQYADPTTPVALRLRPLLPPVATLLDAAAPTLQLDAADVLVDFTLEPEGEDPIRFATFAVVLKTTTQLSIQNGMVESQTLTLVRIDLADAPLFPVEEELIEELLGSLILVAQLANPLATVPIPTNGLSNPGVEIEPSHLSIFGDL